MPDTTEARVVRFLLAWVALNVLRAAYMLAFAVAPMVYFLAYILSPIIGLPLLETVVVILVATAIVGLILYTCVDVRSSKAACTIEGVNVTGGRFTIVGLFLKLSLLSPVPLLSRYQ